jgi:hypothetical protein
MTEKPRVIASRWKTPFEAVDPDKLCLLRVTYPSCPWIHLADGTRYDFSEFSEDGDCEILVFSEEDQTVYRILTDASTVRIHDERDLEQVDEWSPDIGRATMRLTGTELHSSLSSIMNHEEPTYLVATGWDCVEFICLNEPIVEAIGKVEDSRPQLN